MNWLKTSGLILYVMIVTMSCTSTNPADFSSILQGATPTLAPTAIILEPTITPTPIPETYSVEGFQNFIAEVETAVRNERQGLVNRYLINVPQYPLVTETHAIFLWRGTPNKVDLIGEMTHWQFDERLPLTRLSTTDLWYRVEPFAAETQLEYKFLIDEQDDVLDPENPVRIASGFGFNSSFAMPGFVPPAETLPTTAEIPSGTLTTETINSAALGQIRTLAVYTPAQPAQNGSYPSVYIHDGSDYLNFIDAAAILDRLIAAEKIPPMVAVFIPPIDRRVEYDRNPAYVKFLADEVVPFVRNNYNTSNDPAETGSVGASMGGLISVYAALNRPEVFGLVGSQSGALAYGSDTVMRQVQSMPAVDVRFYLTIGSYETKVAGTGPEANFVTANERFAAELRAKGYAFEHEIRPQGHSWGFWQATFGETLIWLYDSE